MKARYSKYLLGTATLILSGMSGASVFAAASCGVASGNIPTLPVSTATLCSVGIPQCTSSTGASTPCLGTINTLGTGAGAGTYRWACNDGSVPVTQCSALKGSTPTSTNCPPLPANAVANTVTSISQARSGGYWVPAAVWSYNVIPSTTECRYTCASGSVWTFGLGVSTGVLDPTFNPGAGGHDIRDLAIQADGKIILAGQFSTFNGVTSPGVVRLNSDGSVDPSFNVGLGSNDVANGIRTIAIQADGKILLGGIFTAFDGVSRNSIVRLNANGSVDTSFVVGTNAGNIISKIIVLSNGQILIGGYFTSISGTTRKHIARLNSNGSLDATFGTTVGLNDMVSSMVVQPDDKIVVAGSFSTFNGTTKNYVARLNSDGSLDGTFDVGLGPNAAGPIVALQADGKIIIGGAFNSFNGVARNRVARVTSAGVIDLMFFPSGIGFGGIQDIVIQADGKILIVGNGAGGVLRLDTSGAIDATFAVGAGVNNGGTSVGIQQDGKILVGGHFTSYNGSAINDVLRLGSDGAGSCQPYSSPCPPLPPTVCDVNDPLLAGVCYTPAINGSAAGAAIVVTGGKVGINTETPQYELDVNGTLRAGAVFALSDKRLKSSIEKIDGALAKIREIHGYEFTRKDSGKADMGVLAQEIEKVFADAVGTDADGYKTVQYNALLAPIVEAIHEINTIIDNDTVQAETQKARIDALVKKIK